MMADPWMHENENEPEIFEIRADHDDTMVFRCPLLRLLSPRPAELASISDGQPVVQTIILTGEEDEFKCYTLDSFLVTYS